MFSTLTLSANDIKLGYQINKDGTGESVIEANYDGFKDHFLAFRTSFSPETLGSDDRSVFAELYPLGFTRGRLKKNKYMMRILPIAYEENFTPGIKKRFGAYLMRWGIFTPHRNASEHDGIDAQFFLAEAAVFGAHHIDVVEDEKLTREENEARDPDWTFSLYEINLALFDVSYTFSNKSYLNLRTEFTNAFSTDGDDVETEQFCGPHMDCSETEHYGAKTFTTKLGAELSYSTKYLGAFAGAEYKHTNAQVSSTKSKSNSFRKKSINMGVRIIF
jgi:hypothetical protein